MLLNQDGNIRLVQTDKGSNEYEDYGLDGFMPCTLLEGYHHLQETCRFIW